MSRKRGPIETPEYGRMVVRMIRAYAKRVTHADEPDLAQMLAVRDEMDAAIVAAIHGQRTVYGRSWADIAAATGTTRQAAQQRWGAKVAQLDASTVETEQRGRVAAYCLDCKAEATQSAAGRPFVMHHADDCPNRQTVSDVA